MLLPAKLDGVVMVVLLLPFSTQAGSWLRGQRTQRESVHTLLPRGVLCCVLLRRWHLLLLCVRGCELCHAAVDSS